MHGHLLLRGTTVSKRVENCRVRAAAAHCVDHEIGIERAFAGTVIGTHARR